MKKTLALMAILLVYSCSSRPAFESFPKIDAHFHLNTSDPAFVELAEKNHFRLMTLATVSSSRAGGVSISSPSVRLNGAKLRLTARPRA